MTNDATYLNPAKKRQRQRLLFIAIAGFVVVSALVLMRVAAGGLFTYYYAPSALLAQTQGSSTPVRLWGQVEPGTIKKGEALAISFAVGDGKARVPVVYSGLVPDLFREGQGVIVEGRLKGDGVFHATSVLAKHDERYMPKGLAEELKQNGVWQGN